MTCADCGKKISPWTSYPWPRRRLCLDCYQTHLENERWREWRDRDMLANEQTENKDRFGGL